MLVLNQYIMSWNRRNNVFIKGEKHLNVKISMFFFPLCVFQTCSIYSRLSRSEIAEGWWNRSDLEANCIKSSFYGGGCALLAGSVLNRGGDLSTLLTLAWVREVVIFTAYWTQRGHSLVENKNGTYVSWKLQVLKLPYFTYLQIYIVNKNVDSRFFLEIDTNQSVSMDLCYLEDSQILPDIIHLEDILLGGENKSMEQRSNLQIRAEEVVAPPIRHVWLVWSRYH